MANVIYNSENAGTHFDELKEGTYFDYEGSLYLLVDEDKGLVFDFEKEYPFYWYDEFDAETVIKTISSDRITIRVD